MSLESGSFWISGAGIVYLLLPRAQFTFGLCAEQQGNPMLRYLDSKVSSK